LKLSASLLILISIDLAICLLLALPWVSWQFLGLIDWINQSLGLGGGPMAISTEAFFFVNLAGVFGVAFNAMLLKSTDPVQHLINNCARLVVVAMIILHIAFGQLPQLFYVFVVTELAGFYATKRWLTGAINAG
jgi:hypothetical protein